MGKTSGKKRSASSVLQMSMNTVRMRAKETNSRGTVGDSVDVKDRDEGDYRKRGISAFNDKNDD